MGLLCALDFQLFRAFGVFNTGFETWVLFATLLCFCDRRLVVSLFSCCYWFVYLLFNVLFCELLLCVYLMFDGFVVWLWLLVCD